MEKKSKLRILKMKDNTDSLATKKETIFNLPMRLLLVGKTGDSKSTYLGNLLLRDEYYKQDFEPGDSPHLKETHRTVLPDAEGGIIFVQMLFQSNILVYVTAHCPSKSIYILNSFFF